MTSQSHETPSPASPSRLCLGCGFPLAPSFRNQCPECGREYNPRDPDTYRSKYGQYRSYKVGGFIGTLCVPFVFLALFSVQYAMMGWWHDTSFVWWWMRHSCPSSWWELNDLGAWLWPTQMFVFLLHSITTGMVISRITLDQHAPKRSR